MSLYNWLDLIISISYFAIPISLLAIGSNVSTREAVPRLWVIQGVLAAGFIFSCGIGHILKGFTFYEWHNNWEIVTAIFSVAEAIAIVCSISALTESVVTVLEGDRSGQILDEVFEQGPGIGLFSETNDSQGRPDLLILRYSRKGKEDIKIEKPEGHLLGELMPTHRTNGLLDAYLEVMKTGEKVTKTIEYHGEKVNSAFFLIASRIESVKPLLQIVWFDVSAEINLKRRLDEAVAKDPLTGLYNRTFIESRLSQSIAELRRSKTPFCLVSADLNKFKRINDSYGHSAGDQVLKTFASIITSNIRDSDVSARMGGDEFLILLPNSDETDGARIAERIMKSFNSQMVLYQNTHIDATSSFGVVEATTEIFKSDRDPKDLIVDQVDQALYAAKAGEGLHVFGDNTSALSILRLESRISEGLKDNEFELYYQPIINLKTKKIAGVEALIRWNHQGQVLFPGSFLGIAEKSGLILDLSKEVLRQGIEKAAKWKCNRDFKMSINLSASIMEHPIILDTILQSVTKYGANPEGLEFEVTETAPMLLTLDTLSLLQSLRRGGSYVSLDDTGAGDNGPIKLLKLIEMNILTGIKIDIELVKRINTSSRPIVNGLIRLAEENGLTVVAEGIEDEYLANELLNLGCQYGQGYWFAKALPGTDLEDRWL